MRKVNIILAIIGLALLSYSCYNEDRLIPSGQFIPSGLPFPQGDNPWDEEIVKLHDTYGVYVFYKDVTEALLNREWTSVGTGDIYTGGDLSDDKVQFYVDFIKNDVFKYVNKELVTKTLPVRLYLLDNFRTRPRIENNDEGDTGTGGTDTGGTGTGGTGTGGTGTGGTGTGGTGTGGTGTGGTGTGGTGTGGTGTGGTGTGGTGTGGTGTGGTGTGGTGTGGTGTGGTGTGGTGTGGTGTGGTGTGGTGTGGTGTGGTGTGGTGTGGTGTGGTGTTDPNFVPFYADGFDYWALSFTDDEIQNITHEARRLRSVPFIYHMLKKAVMSEIITDIDDIREGVNTTKGFRNDDLTNPNHCFNRGFPEDLSESFNKSNKPWSPSVYFHKTAENYPHGDFLNLIRTNMWYSLQELEVKYPQEKYPLIRKRLDIVHKHLLDNYGIDLRAIGANSDSEQ